MFRVVNLVKSYFLFNLKACMEYRAAFIGQLFAVCINNGFFMIFWYIIFSKVDGNLNGYIYKDIVMLWSIVAASFGLSEVVFGNGSKISKIIYNGDLDVYILQPKPILVNLVSSRMVMLGWGDVLYGYVVFFIVFGLDPIRLPLFILFSITGALVYTAFRVIIHSLTFYIGNNEVLSMTLENTLLSVSTYPATIFKGPILILLYTALPAGFITFIPVEIISNFNLMKFILVILADALFITISVLFFYRGVRHYESGNMIGTRM